MRLRTRCRDCKVRAALPTTNLCWPCSVVRRKEGGSWEPKHDMPYDEGTLPSRVLVWLMRLFRQRPEIF